MMMVDMVVDTVTAEAWLTESENEPGAAFFARENRDREREGEQSCFSVYFREREEKKWKMKAERDSEGEQMRGQRIPKIFT